MKQDSPSTHVHPNEPPSPNVGSKGTGLTYRIFTTSPDTPTSLKGIETPKLGLPNSGWVPVGSMITAQALLDACCNAPKVPDLADVLEWKSVNLVNVSHFYERLVPAFFQFLANPPNGFGFSNGRAVLATWHLRDSVEKGKWGANPWSSPAIHALDVIANGITLWRLWRCGCGRPLGVHLLQIHEGLFTAEQQHELESSKEYRIKPTYVWSLDCGRLFRAPAWFEHTRNLPYPSTPETVAAVMPLVRDVAREWLWQCLQKYYSPEIESITIPTYVSDYFKKADKLTRPERSQNKKCVEYSPGNNAGEVIRDGVNEIERALKRYAKAGVAGAGLGLMRYKGAMIFSVT